MDQDLVCLQIVRKIMMFEYKRENEIWIYEMKWLGKKMSYFLICGPTLRNVVGVNQ